MGTILKEIHKALSPYSKTALPLPPQTSKKIEKTSDIFKLTKFSGIHEPPLGGQSYFHYHLWLYSPLPAGTYHFSTCELAT